MVLRRKKTQEHAYVTVSQVKATVLPILIKAARTSMVFTDFALDRGWKRSPDQTPKVADSSRNTKYKNDYASLLARTKAFTA